jgi:hypothetical protein
VATVYVSYRSTEGAFVRSVVERLEERHQIRIDYKLPAGTDWRVQQLEELRNCDVFLVFVSKDTRESDFQNAEMGSARFCQAYVDGKTLIPVLIDKVDPPRPLTNLCLDLSQRDADAAAKRIDQEIARRAPRVRLFLSHAHLDADVAQRLVDVIVSNLVVPEKELRCTSVPGYQLALGQMAAEALRRELDSALGVIALLTPNSIGNPWVLFELGGAWANAKEPIPLLAGVESKEIRGPLHDAAPGQLADPATLDRLIDQLERLLGWPARTGPAALSKRRDFVEFIKSKSFAQSVPADGEQAASFTAKQARIGPRQGLLLSHLVKKGKGRPYLSLDELGADDIAGSGNELYYRMEQLRLLGFVNRVELGKVGDTPTFGWTLSEKYRREIEG